MKRPNPGSAIGVAGVLASVAAVWIAVAALEIPDHKDVWSNSWVLGGVGLAVIAVLIALYALFIPGQVEEQGQRAGQAVGGKMRLTFTEPALAVNGTARYSNLEKWLSNPLDSKNPTSFPVQGRVSPSPIGLKCGYACEPINGMTKAYPLLTEVVISAALYISTSEGLKRVWN